MRVIKPITITDALFTSSTVPETDYAAWNAATSYTLGARVIRTTTHRVYVCLIAGVDAVTPEASCLLTSSPRWLDYGPTNRWAMFDGQVSTATAIASPLTVVLHPGVISDIGLINVVGVTASVLVVDGSTTVYSESINLDLTEIRDWYEYFFSGFTLRNQVVFKGIPPFSAGVVTVSITGGGTVSCGLIIAGNGYDIGGTQYEPTLEILDYSTKTVDEFGMTTFIKRKNASKAEFSILIDNVRLSSVFGLVRSLTATPSLWVGSDDITMDVLTVYGWFSGFSITVPYPHNSICTLQIQGLI
jgi:hypothetical protein